MIFGDNMGKMKEKILKIKRERWLRKNRKRVKNNNFTIISNNCTAGFIYHDLGMQFKTPTINLFFKTDQYITFLKDLDYYLKCPLEEVENSERSYPVGILKSNDKNKIDIYVYFNHYNSFSEAKEKWEDRKKRVNYNNICFILDFYDSAYDVKLIDEFNEIDEKDKIVLIHNKKINKPNCFCFNYEEEKVPNGKLFKLDGTSGKRYLDEFDYVSFVNNITKK